MHGRLLWAREFDDADDEVRSYRRLLMAVVLQAVRDAVHGDNDAAAWLDADAADVAQFLSLRPAAFFGWRAVGRVGSGARRASLSREAARERRRAVERAYRARRRSQTR